MVFERVLTKLQSTGGQVIPGVDADVYILDFLDVLSALLSLLSFSSLSVFRSEPSFRVLTVRRSSQAGAIHRAQMCSGEGPPFDTDGLIFGPDPDVAAGRRPSTTARLGVQRSLRPVRQNNGPLHSQTLQTTPVNRQEVS